MTDPVLRGILVQQKSSFDLRRIMDEGKILLVNLAKGRIGEEYSGPSRRASPLMYRARRPQPD